MTDADLARWEASCAAATPAPWHAPGLGEVHSDHDANVYVRVNAGPAEGTDEAIVADGCADHDAAFMVAARTAVPALIAEVRRLRAEAASLTLTEVAGQPYLVQRPPEGA